MCRCACLGLVGPVAMAPRPLKSVKVSQSGEPLQDLSGVEEATQFCFGFFHLPKEVLVSPPQGLTHPRLPVLVEVNLSRGPGDKPGDPVGILYRRSRRFVGWQVYLLFFVGAVKGRVVWVFQWLERVVDILQ